MSIPNFERETHICFMDSDKVAYVYTGNRPLLHKLDRLCEEDTEFSVRYRSDFDGDYIIPKESISIRKLMKISDELRAKKALEGKRLTKLRAKSMHGDE